MTYFCGSDGKVTLLPTNAQHFGANVGHPRLADVVPLAVLAGSDEAGVERTVEVAFTCGGVVMMTLPLTRRGVSMLARWFARLAEAAEGMPAETPKIIVPGGK